MTDVTVLYVEIRHRWWLKIYLYILTGVFNFVRDYINVDAELDHDKVERVIWRGSYLSVNNRQEIKGANNE